MTDVLVVEDDDGLRASLTRSLTERGHRVWAVEYGREAIDAVETPVHPVEIVVLDLGLPDMDGTEVLIAVRTLSTVPIIVATGRDDEAEIVTLLDAGADDYIVKPYSIDQLDARIRAVLRRLAAFASDRKLCVGALVIDLATRSTTLADETLQLSRKEFDLLAVLAGHVGEVVSKRELLADVWHQPYGGADKTIDVHLSWLRRKLGETADRPVYLHTVRGVGVKMVAPE